MEIVAIYLKYFTITIIPCIIDMICDPEIEWTALKTKKTVHILYVPQNLGHPNMAFYKLTLKLLLGNAEIGDRTNRLIFGVCGLEIGLMTLKNNGTLFLYPPKLCATFRHLCVETGVIV